MAQLTSKQKERLKALGISTKDEATAKNELLAFLAGNEITEVDEDPLEELLDMAEALGDAAVKAIAGSDAAKEELEELDEEDDEDKEESDEEEGDEEEGDEEKDEEKEDLEELAGEVAKENVKAKVTEKKAAAATAAKAAKKGDAPAEKKKSNLPVKVRDGETFKQGDPAHVKMVEALTKDLFPKKDYNIKILAQGFAVRLNQVDSTTRCLLVFNFLKVKDGKLKGRHVALNALRLSGDKGAEVALANLPESYADDERVKTILQNLPIVENVTEDEFREIMTPELVTLMRGYLEKLDTRLNDNRAKLEEKVAAANTEAKAKSDAKGAKAEPKKAAPAPEPAAKAGNGAKPAAANAKPEPKPVAKAGKK